jgi:hypothetical protein
MKLRRSQQRRAAALAAFALTLACLSHSYVRAQAEKPTEYQVKAAYLSNFGRFIEWPADQSPGEAPHAGEGNPPVEPFPICVLGTDPFGPALDRALKDETINRAPLVPKRIAKVQDNGGCRILFVAQSEESQLKPILAALNGVSLLTVSDIPDFTKRGGMIQFVLDGNRVRFEVNLAAVQRARLNLSSELTKLATTVRRTP